MNVSSECNSVRLYASYCFWFFYILCLFVDAFLLLLTLSLFSSSEDTAQNMYSNGLCRIKQPLYPLIMYIIVTTKKNNMSTKRLLFNVFIVCFCVLCQFKNFICTFACGIQAVDLNAAILQWYKRDTYTTSRNRNNESQIQQSENKIIKRFKCYFSKILKRISLSGGLFTYFIIHGQ